MKIIFKSTSGHDKIIWEYNFSLLFIIYILYIILYIIIGVITCVEDDSKV